jgi:hypothetical protein
MNFFHEASHSLIAASSFRHSQTLLSSTPKIAVALRFPSFSAHGTASHLISAVYDSLSGFWHPSFMTTVHDKLEEAPPTF